MTPGLQDILSTLQSIARFARSLAANDVHHFETMSQSSFHSSLIVSPPNAISYLCMPFFILDR